MDNAGELGRQGQLILEKIRQIPESAREIFAFFEALWPLFLVHSISTKSRFCRIGHSTISVEEYINLNHVDLIFVKEKPKYKLDFGSYEFKCG